MKKSVLTLAGGLLLAFPQLPILAQDQSPSEAEAECRFTIAQNGSATLTPGCETQMQAMESDEDRANLLFRIAYALNENKGALGALEMLDQALELVPDNKGYLHERGYTHADLGYYSEALEDLDRVLEIDPAHGLSLNERGWVRQTTGDFEGALDDYERYLDVGGDENDIIMSRARIYVWLGRLDEAQADLDTIAAAGEGGVEPLRERIARIRTYQPDGDPAQLCKLSETMSEPEQASVLFDACTRAFLDESDPNLKADYLTVRATSRQIMEDDLSSGVEEMQIAIGIDPLVPRRHLNFGFVLLSASHSWAARNSFDTALKLGLAGGLPNAIALAGRAGANYNLGEKGKAHDDAQASLEMQPTAAAFSIMGDLAFDTLDFDVAKEAWLLAWGLSGGTDALRAKLASINVFDPDAENGE